MARLKEPRLKLKCAHRPNHVTVVLVVVVEVAIGEIDVPCVILVVLGTTPAVRGRCCVY